MGMRPVWHQQYIQSSLGLTLTNNFEWACHLEVWCEGVGQPHVAWEGTENKVSHLDAVRRDDIAE